MSLTIKEYFAQAGTAFTNADARVIGPVLQELAADGDITPEAVVHAAHSANSPLRSYFEWDDKIAAGHYREGQAREMIHAVRVRFVSGGKEYATRAYNIVVKKTDNLPREIETAQILPHPNETFLEALRELDAWRLRYVHLETYRLLRDMLTPLFNQIAEFRDEFANGEMPLDVEKSLEILTQWRSTVELSVTSTALYGEQVGYMAEAIDQAWDAYAKMKGNRGIRLSAVEEENEKLREQVHYLERLLVEPSVMPPEFKLTGKESAVVQALLAKEVATKENILHALYSDRPNDIPDAKIVDVFIHKVRAKLKPHGILIETSWGQGFSMPAESKAELRGMIAARKAAAA